MPPHVCQLRPLFKDYVFTSLLGQQVADAETCLTSSNYNRVDLLSH